MGSCDSKLGTRSCKCESKKTRSEEIEIKIVKLFRICHGNLVDKKKSPSPSWGKSLHYLQVAYVLLLWCCFVFKQEHLRFEAFLGECTCWGIPVVSFASS